VVSGGCEALSHRENGEDEAVLSPPYNRDIKVISSEKRIKNCFNAQCQMLKEKFNSPVQAT